MAIAFRAAASNATTASSLSITKPASTANLDVLLAWIYVDTTTTITGVPTGWVAVDNIQETTSSYHAYVYRLVCGGSEPASYSWTLSASAYTEGVIAGFSGVDNTTPVDAHAIADRGSTQSPVTPSITASVAGDALVACLGVYFGNTGASAQNGYTLPTNGQVSAGDFWLEYKLGAASGANGGDTFSCTAGASGAVAALVALAPAGGGSTVSGSVSFSSNSLLAEAAQVAAPATVQANSLLTETARIVASATTQSNSLLAESAQIVEPSAPLQSNSLLAEFAQIATPTAPVQSNSALLETAALIVDPSIPVQSNSLLNGTGGLAGAGGGSLISNSAIVEAGQVAAPATVQSTSAIVEAGQVVASATMQSSSVLAEAARILAAATLQSTSALVATGSVITAAAVIIGLCATNTVAAHGGAVLADKAVNGAALASAAIGAAGMADKAVNTETTGNAGIGTVALADI